MDTGYTLWIQNGYTLETKWIQNGYKMDTLCVLDYYYSGLYIGGTD